MTVKSARSWTIARAKNFNGQPIKALVHESELGQVTAQRRDAAALQARKMVKFLLAAADELENPEKCERAQDAWLVSVIERTHLAFRGITYKKDVRYHRMLVLEVADRLTQMADKWALYRDNEIAATAASGIFDYERTSDGNSIPPPAWEKILAAWRTKPGRPRGSRNHGLASSGKWDTLATLINAALGSVENVSGEALEVDWKKWKAREGLIFEMGEPKDPAV